MALIARSRCALYALLLLGELLFLRAQIVSLVFPVIYFYQVLMIKCLFPYLFGTSRNLPIAVQSETPFFRSRDELNVMGRKGGAPPTRFLGVSRIIESNRANSGDDKRHYTGKFGVEFPLFDTKVDPLVPKSATITGRTVLIRNDLTEDVAGRLYAFMFRLLYGTAVVERMLQKTNSLAENASLVQDTLRAFGANEEDEEASNL